MIQKEFKNNFHNFASNLIDFKGFLRFLRIFWMNSGIFEGFFDNSKELKIDLHNLTSN